MHILNKAINDNNAADSSVQNLYVTPGQLEFIKIPLNNDNIETEMSYYHIEIDDEDAQHFANTRGNRQQELQLVSDKGELI